MLKFVVVVASVIFSAQALAHTDESQVAVLQHQVKALAEQLRTVNQELDKRASKDDLNQLSARSIVPVPEKCEWSEWVLKWDYIETMSCKEGQVANAIRFSHKGGEPGTHQESVSVQCCSLVYTPKP